MKKFYYYIVFVFFYLFLFLHNLKEKVVFLIGSSTDLYNLKVSRDYIFFIVFFIFLFYFFLYRSKNFNVFFKKNQPTLFLTFSSLNLFGAMVYSQLKLIFLFDSSFCFFYKLELIFFSFFGLFGILIPLFFLNQFFFFIGYILIILIDKIFSFFFYKNQLILGVWSHCSLSELIMGLSIFFIYLFCTVLRDFLKEKKSKEKKEQTTSWVNIKKEKIREPTEEKIELEKGFIEKEHIQNIYRKETKEVFEEKDLREELIKILNVFNIKGEFYKILSGLTVTNYFFKPKSGTKMCRVESIEEEISIELNRNVRVASNLQGIIFEVSNENFKSFSFSSLWDSETKASLPLFLGFDSFGEKVILDLVKQPHILMCGTTGSGKSSTLHCMIHSLMTTKDPSDLKFVFIDPKILELSVYKNSPFLFLDLVTNIEDGEKALQLIIKEMEERYKKISQISQRSIGEYNKKVKKEDKIPYLVCVIEEFADLVLYKNNSFKTNIQRIAQMGRAGGIHLIIATQRPSANVVDGVIKANFPCRVALKVANKLESRIILDRSGAERMERPGEMLILDISGNLKRVIAPYISEEETEKLMEFFLEKKI